MLTMASERVTLPLREPFAISRGTVTQIAVVRVTMQDGSARGRGECRPYPRYDETPESVLAEIESQRKAIEIDEPVVSRNDLRSRMKAGAARNALDCALVDLECKRSGRRAHELLGLPPTSSFVTAFTIGLGSPQSMREAAARAVHRPLLKIKLGGEGDLLRVRAVRDAAPRATLLVDPNEAWGHGETGTTARLQSMLDAMRDLDVKLVEQPLHASADALLRTVRRSVPVCADESVHQTADLAELRDRYDAVNVKCDKTGGITEAVELAREARRLGFSLMVGCMLSSSLAIAPASLLTPLADFIDLDGPVWLRDDIAAGLEFTTTDVSPPTSALWG